VRDSGQAGSRHACRYGAPEEHPCPRGGGFFAPAALKNGAILASIQGRPPLARHRPAAAGGSDDPR
jgi:hypothetical protein